VLGWSRGDCEAFLLTAYFTTKAFAVANADAVTHFGKRWRLRRVPERHQAETVDLVARLPVRCPKPSSIPRETFATTLEHGRAAYIDAS